MAGVDPAGFDRALAEHAEMLEALRPLGPEVTRAASLVAERLRAGGTLLICGNGGSAADAQHIAAEFVGRFLRERRAWPAIALHANTSAVTAIGNDYGFDEVFARQVRAHGRPGDVLLAISTSGRSANVLRAAEAAREKGIATIALAGPDGGKMADLCDITLRVPAASTPRIQEGHILLGHVICGLVEDALSDAPA